MAAEGNRNNQRDWTKGMKPGWTWEREWEWKWTVGNGREWDWKRYFRLSL